MYMYVQGSTQSEQESPTQSSTTLLTAVSLASALGMQLSSLNSAASGQQQQQQQSGSNLSAAQMMMVHCTSTLYDHDMIHLFFIFAYTHVHSILVFC